MPELDFCIFFGQVDHKWVEITERGAEDELRTVEIDHRFHSLGAAVGLRDVLLLDHLDARDPLQSLGCYRMCLIPAEIVARTDIDDTDRQLSCRLGEAREEACPGDPGGSDLQEFPARQMRYDHNVLPLV